MTGNHDSQLLSRATAGDLDAVAALLGVHGPAVHRKLKISRIWQAMLDAADVMQVTYLQAFTRIRQFDGTTEESFAAWLMRLADNNLRDAIRALQRSKRPDPRRRVVVTLEDSVSTLLESLGVTTPTASGQLVGREADALLHAAIERLPESYRRVVVLFDLEGRPAKEVGQAVGRSPGAVYMLRARAHDRLRELLGSPSGFFVDRA